MKKRKSIQRRDSLLIVCISDTHRLHTEIEVPDGDVLIHAGDICHQGESRQTLIDFNAWLGELPHSLKVCVPGNHDLPLEFHANRKLLSNATVLVNRGIEFMGVYIWGTPVTPLWGGAFGIGYAPDRRRLFARIPQNTDILVSHGPAYGVLDCAPLGGYHAGDPELMAAIEHRDISAHIFGHVHAGHGVKATERTVFVNASVLGEDGGIGWDPVVLKLPKR